MNDPSLRDELLLLLERGPLNARVMVEDLPEEVLRCGPLGALRKMVAAELARLGERRTPPPGPGKDARQAAIADLDQLEGLRTELLGSGAASASTEVLAVWVWEDMENLGAIASAAAGALG